MISRNNWSNVAKDYGQSNPFKGRRKRIVNDGIVLLIAVLVALAAFGIWQDIVSPDLD